MYTLSTGGCVIGKLLSSLDIQLTCIWYQYNLYRTLKGRRSSMVTLWVAVVRIRVQVLEVETRISQSQYIISHWLCKKGDYLGSLAIQRSCTWYQYNLIPRYLARSFIHYGDSHWDTFSTQQRWNCNAGHSWDNDSSRDALEHGTGPSGYTKLSQPTPWRLISKLRNYGCSSNQFWTSRCNRPWLN